jgi:hypothetical protein
MGSSEADRETYTMEENFNTETKCSAGPDISSSEESKRFAKITISDVSQEAESPTRTIP